MREGPILFSAPMIRAILAGNKTVTRRLSRQWLKLKAGDLLWVRETFVLQGDADGDEPPYDDGRPVWRTSHPDDGEHWSQPIYRATDQTPELECTNPKCKVGEKSGGPCCHWRPSIFMPRWASRIMLEVTEDAQVERLQNISEAEALAEGFTVSLSSPYWQGFERIDGRRIPISVGAGEDGSQPAPGWMESAELVPSELIATALQGFLGLWHKLHDKPGERWNDNPEVVRIAFKARSANAPKSTVGTKAEKSGHL
jgi:hypothetical protein